MSQELTELIDKFNAIYKPLVILNNEVADTIEHGNVDCITFNNETNEDVANFIRNLEYAADEESGSTPILPAVIPMSKIDIEKIGMINHYRKQMAELLKSLGRQTSPTGILLTKYILDKVHLRRMNRKAAARKFTILNQAPSHLNFIWTQSAVTNKFTKTKAINTANHRIEKETDQGILTQLYRERSLLEQLPDDELLVRVYKPTLMPKVTILINKVRMPVKPALMPLFYTLTEGEIPPVITPLPLIRELPVRQRRSDSKIEEEPFAPLLKMHKYL